jgi:hypothetical protein
MILSVVSGMYLDAESLPGDDEESMENIQWYDGKHEAGVRAWQRA